MTKYYMAWGIDRQFKTKLGRFLFRYSRKTIKAMKYYIPRLLVAALIIAWCYGFASYFTGG